jgi:hypothetical protein
MESAGSVAGLVSSAQGEPLSDALVVLGRARADGSMEWQRRVRTDADGTYALGGVEPGAYQVRASESSHAPETVDLNVPRRSETRRDFQLDPLPIAGDVSGAIRSRTGTYRNPILLWLHGEGSRRDGTVKWEREGVEWVGRFSFEDLPHGEYTLFAQAMLGEKMEPASVRVTPPDSSVALTVLDQAQPDPIAFTVIDAATREPLPSFEVRLWNDETMGFYVTLPSVHQNERLGTLLPEGSSWMVRVGGYQLASGDDADLLPAEIDGEPVRMAHLELEAGWGARFLVKGPDGPLEGATLFLDGIERATTDERGFAIGNAPAKPATAAVLYRDWVVTGGAVDPVTGALAEGGLATVIELAPPR